MSRGVFSLEEFVCVASPCRTATFVMSTSAAGQRMKSTPPLREDSSTSVPSCLKEIRGGVPDVVLTALCNTSEMEIPSWWTTRSQQVKGLVLVERLIWAITKQSPSAKYWWGRLEQLPPATQEAQPSVTERTHRQVVGEDMVQKSADEVDLSIEPASIQVRDKFRQRGWRHW